MTEYDLSAMRDALPRQAAEILAEMGIAQADFSGLFQTSFSDVLRAVTGVVRGAMREPVAFFSAGCGLLLLLGLFSAAGKPDGKPSQLRTFLAALFLVTASSVPLHSVLADAVAALRTCSTFLCTLIPILAAVIAAAGNPVLSVVWHTAVFTAAQTVAATASGFMAPCCGMVAGVGIFDSLLPQMQFGDLAGKIRKTAIWVFSSAATLFTTFLSLKGILAGAADSLAAKGIKLAVSSFIPVVGAQLSEAYASVVGRRICRGGGMRRYAADGSGDPALDRIAAALASRRFGAGAEKRGLSFFRVCRSAVRAARVSAFCDRSVCTVFGDHFDDQGGDMMQTLSGLLAGVCFAAALGGLIHLLSPGGSTERLLHLMIALFVIAAAAVPFKGAARNILAKNEPMSTDAAVQAVLDNAERALEQAARRVLEKYGCADAEITVAVYAENGEVHAADFSVYGAAETKVQEIAHEIFELTGEMPNVYAASAARDRE